MFETSDLSELDLKKLLLRKEDHFLILKVKELNLLHYKKRLLLLLMQMVGSLLLVLRMRRSLVKESGLF